MGADLHIHTTISDGSWTVEQVIEEAKKQSLTHIAITNHDTVQGLKEAIHLGKAANIQVIPGIEISAYDYTNNRKVHLLGYDFQLDAPHMKALCEPLLKRRHENTVWQIRKLQALGYHISECEILKRAETGGVVYKQHIMEKLIRQGYTDSIYSPLYRELFKGNGPCNRDIEYVDVWDALKAIKDDQGIAVLAHPGQLNSYELIPSLVACGLDGIEYAHKDHTPSDHQKIESYEKAYNLILTGGSDFHGAYGQGQEQIGRWQAPKGYGLENWMKKV
ncbi:MAG: PHP domain-containing protein [Cellulosilyticaceae bacterium]